MQVYRLNPRIVIRKEVAGALIFHRADARTIYVDHDELLLIYELVSGRMKRDRLPVSLIMLLLKTGIVTRNCLPDSGNWS